jgi:hypothetical protein
LIGQISDGKVACTVRGSEGLQGLLLEHTLLACLRQFSFKLLELRILYTQTVLLWQKINDASQRGKFSCIEKLTCIERCAFAAAMSAVSV